MTTQILGLDPGLKCTGWGIVKVDGHRISHVAHGVIASNHNLSLAERLNQLYQGLSKVLKTYQLTEAAVEETFVNKNAKSTLKLGEARGVVLLAPAHVGLAVSEYSANRIKKSVVGNGHADKNQVITMVKHILPTCGELTADAADALAVAICHTHYQTTKRRWEGLLSA